MIARLVVSLVFVFFVTTPPRIQVIPELSRELVIRLPGGGPWAVESVPVAGRFILPDRIKLVTAAPEEDPTDSTGDELRESPSCVLFALLSLFCLCSVFGDAEFASYVWRRYVLAGPFLCLAFLLSATWLLRRERLHSVSWSKLFLFLVILICFFGTA